MGYIITKGQSPNTYTGYRCATSDMEVNQGEKFIESLEGYAQEVLELPLSVEQKRLLLAEQFKELPLATRLAFQSVAISVDASLRLQDIELAVYTLEQAKSVEGANTDLVQEMINLLENN